MWIRPLLFSYLLRYGFPCVFFGVDIFKGFARNVPQAGKLPYCLYKIFSLSHGDHFFESKRVKRPG